MRLIDADKIQYTMLYKENWMVGTGKEEQGVWKSDIDKMPTIDERKAGTWTMDGFCTVCGEEAITEWNDCGGELAFTKYCPNCGAKMSRHE